ncbi:MAG: nucleoside deaminase [Bacteroidales bacterium]|jgi:tRNA(Arg) A34 adenosine deaminase TadA|nr:nucleoside deaminase [Bacteroidales bacterium]
MNNISTEDKKFLQIAIDLAVENAQSGQGGPFGAIVVKNGEIIATGSNIVTVVNDPTAHAEVTAIRNACEKLNDFQLENCTIYSSCEPCPMCLGAIYWARPTRLVYAATKDDAAKAGFDDSFIYHELEKEQKDRTIKTEQIMRKEGFEPFEIWINSEDKIEY